LKQLRTPRAAAFAGIVFAVLFTTSMVLIRISIPEELNVPNTTAVSWFSGSVSPVTIALTLIPFAGIAFLWFIGVIRDRLGPMEDRFFATVFLGSGLLFLAMMFASAAIAGAILTAYSLLEDTIVQSGVLTFGRAMMYTITNLYAFRMAGVFMISLGTLWIRTGVMPRFFVFLTYGLAAVMLVAPTVSLWFTLVFPLWVFVISVYLLVVTRRRELLEAEELRDVAPGQ
jgi:hypothetical protein